MGIVLPWWFWRFFLGENDLIVDFCVALATGLVGIVGVTEAWWAFSATPIFGNFCLFVLEFLRTLGPLIRLHQLVAAARARD